MKAIKRSFIFSFLLVIISSGKAQTLEIHQMSVGGADAAVIVVRNVALMKQRVQSSKPALVPANDYELLRVALQNKINLSGTVKKAVLIDAAENSAKYATKIHKYLQEIGVGKALDYVVLSHLDKDHYGGFKDLLGKWGYTVTFKAYHPDNITAGYPQASPTCNTSFFNHATLAAVGKKEIARVNNTEINLGPENGIEIKLTCVVADCFVLGQNPAVDHSHCPGSNDYNDHCVGWILQYGAFRFYTGGDLNGLFPKYAVETSLVDSLKRRDPAAFTEFVSGAVIPKGHTCAIKINHHGSDYSTNAYFLSTLKPKTAFISCGYHQGHRHPRPGVIADLEAPNWDISDWTAPNTLQPNTLEKYFVTALLNNLDPPVNAIGSPAVKGVVGGDLVLIVNDTNIATESTFAVYYNGRLSTALEGKKGKDPNDKNVGGLRYFTCHKKPNAMQPYFTNH